MEGMLIDLDGAVILTAGEQDFYKIVGEKLKNELHKIESYGPTAKLWVQYFRMVTFMKQFIEAERRCKWKIHLDTFQKMLPFFHASEETMDPKEYTLFTGNGYFTIRHSEKFWSGIWSDMTIEQSLMRTMKCVGGCGYNR
ncbi:hypothetical protein PR048_014343 [Dryococelus australis]|uniref:Uncharacterized protein n=1 Tax=Dryococelus australis TaxID=614101 RepID=A0ABQ9HE62_9NEOP|nr:hypothetical protein PR048_014343 [Dryococelus australis]